MARLVGRRSGNRTVPHIRGRTRARQHCRARGRWSGARGPASQFVRTTVSAIWKSVCAPRPLLAALFVGAPRQLARQPATPEGTPSGCQASCLRRGLGAAVRGRLLLKCFMDVSTTPALLALTRQQVFELFFQGPVMKKQFKNSLAGLGYRVSDMRFAVRRFWRRWFGRFVWGLCFRSAWRFSVALEVRWLVQSFCQSGAFPVVAVLGSVGLVA